MLPLVHYHFDLPLQQFYDTLSLHHNQPIMLMPSSDGCGTTFNLLHALDCQRGKLVTRGHNMVQDALGKLASWVYRGVVWESVVHEKAFSSFIVSVNG